MRSFKPVTVELCIDDSTELSAIRNSGRNIGSMTGILIFLSPAIQTAVSRLGFARGEGCKF
jgi:hypothetical protein